MTEKTFEVETIFSSEYDETLHNDLMKQYKQKVKDAIAKIYVLYSNPNLKNFTMKNVYDDLKKELGLDK